MINRDEKGRFLKGSKPWHIGTKGIFKPTKGCFKKDSISWNKNRKGLQISNKKNKTFEELYGEDKAKEIKNIIKEKRKNQINSEHQKEVVSKIMKGNKYSKLRKSFSISEEHKEKLLKASIGRVKSKEEIQKLKEARKLQIFPIKDTSIEIKIQNFLKQLGLEFYTHQYIKNIEHGYQCDILIPVQEGINKKTIIECFGTYWHNYPLGREVDIKRCNELREQGYRVLVFWENEIKVMELNNLQEVLIR